MPSDGQRLYEGLFLIDPGFANKDPNAAVELCQGVLKKHGATVIRAELWSEQRLAYEVRGNKRGAYVLTAFRAETMKMGEIELECRLTERILRYLFTNREGVPIEKWFKRYEVKAPRPREVEVEIDRDEEPASTVM
jgi:small subunit ribosomal protein S6